MTHVVYGGVLLANTAKMTEVIGSGIVKIELNQTFALADDDKMHQVFEGRTATGSAVAMR